MGQENHQDYCAEQVRLYDYDRYFAAALAPEHVRRGLYAIYALNLEIASVRERVSEPILGEMRLQWWRDTLDGIYAGTTRNFPITTELAHAIERFGLDRARIDRMIDARVFDLGDDAPEDVNAFENYVDATAGELSVLAFSICGVSDAPELAGKIGRIWGTAGLLRSISHHAAQRRIYLPKDLMRNAQITAEDITDRGRVAGLSSVVETLAQRIWEHRADLGTIPKPARPAAAYMTVATGYLARLRTRKFDVFAPGLEVSRLRRQLGILKTGFTGRI